MLTGIAYTFSFRLMLVGIWEHQSQTFVTEQPGIKLHLQWFDSVNTCINIESEVIMYTSFDLRTFSHGMAWFINMTIIHSCIKH